MATHKKHVHCLIIKINTFLFFFFPHKVKAHVIFVKSKVDSANNSVEAVFFVFDLAHFQSSQ